LIPRYSLPEMAAVWSDEARLANWLEIEILAVEAWADLGRVPRADAAAVRERAAVTVAAVLERERVTRHDVAAFVDVVAASVGPEGRWIHFGLTSSDVLDTGLALQLRAAADILLARLEVQQKIDGKPVDRDVRPEIAWFESGSVRGPARNCPDGMP